MSASGLFLVLPDSDGAGSIPTKKKKKEAEKSLKKLKQIQA